jgi:hypothetical protein
MPVEISLVGEKASAAAKDEVDEAEDTDLQLVSPGDVITR